MKEKTVSEAVAFRRSTRVYDPEKPIDNELVKECIKHASLAPTSSNLQLWEFYHITSDPKERNSCCMFQSTRCKDSPTNGDPCCPNGSLASTCRSEY